MWEEKVHAFNCDLSAPPPRKRYELYNKLETPAKDTQNATNKAIASWL